MASRQDFYFGLLDDSIRDPSITLESVFQDIFGDLDGRVVATEAGVNDFLTVKDDILGSTLSYIADKLTPQFETLRDLADFGLLFEATSQTTATVATGYLTLIVDEAARFRYTPPGYIGAFAASVPNTAVAGAKVSYDRASGQLVINVDRIVGGGSVTGWTLSPVSATDNLTAVPVVNAARDAAASSAMDAAAARDAARGYRDQTQTARDTTATYLSSTQTAATATAANLAGINAAARIYCGNGATPPTALPDGSALVNGAEWYDPVNSVRKQWTGTSWDAIYVPAAAAVSSFNGRTGAVSPASGDYNAGQVTVSPSIAGGATVQAALAGLVTSIATKADASALSGYALVSHTHAISDVTGLTSALAGKSDVGHSHAISDVTGLTSALAGKSDTSHVHSAATSTVAGFMSALDKAKLDNVADGATNYVHPTGDGNLHVPATSTTHNGQFLKAGSTAGSFGWSTIAFSDVGSVPAALSTIGGLTPAADRVPYFTGTGAAALATFTSIGRSVVGAADAAAVKVAIAAADVSHSHVVGDVSGLQSALDAKLAITTAATTYQGVAANLTTIAGYSTAYMTRLGNFAALTGGGLAVVKTDGTVVQALIAQGTGITVTNSDGTGGNPTIAFNTTFGDARYVTVGGANSFVQTSSVGAAGGVASLDGTGLIPAAQMPVATSLALGAIKIGSGLSITSGVVSAAVLSVAGRTGAVTLSATDVSGLAAVATTGSASDLGSGTIPAARLPVATGAAFGAVKSGANLTNTAGVLSLASGNVTAALGFTPADVASLAAVATSGSASDLGSGTIGAARLPVATGAAFGAVKSGSNLTNTSGTLSITSANVIAALGFTPANVGGDTFSSNVSILGILSVSNGTFNVDATTQSANVFANLKADTGQQTALRMFTGTSIRWSFGKNATAEAGLNQGSDLVLTAYDDSGTSLGAAMTITRGSKKVTVSAPGGNGASFNITPGTTPGSFSNGDIWPTSAALFARIGGNTVQLAAAGANADITGLSALNSLSLGGGTALTKILTATASLDFPSTAAGATSDLPITVTGAALNDGVVVGPPGSPNAAGSYYGFVSSANTVTVRFCNITGAAVNPGAQTFRVTVFSY